MPTATKLMSALVFALLAFFASEVFKPLLPEGTKMGLLSFVNAGIGLLCGWMIMGRLAGRGKFAAAGGGVRTSLALAFWCLLFWSIWEMLRQSTRPGTYEGVVEAINGAFALMFDYALLILTDARMAFTLAEGSYFLPQVPVVLIVGGMLCGWFAEWTEERSADAGKIA
ncbi:TrgA family protein [Vannielia litorea]|uniref:TrgA family protein n=1 Tax=Vannielia TaxID=2813041 RepID=UPI001C96D0EF|nr:TrgA family protein [Vannielia litorea]MBY6047628.1 TrgA family protein [Vannielia litorea]MBY6075042.1 TrgA family protein [Vannielia litorea]MBY6152436.1 TrgA family protein [Vannielia litorea]